MLDAWSIGIFIGFDTDDADALMLQSGKEMTALLLGELTVA